MLKEYIGPHDEVRVAVAGREFGVVKRGEKLAVPDEIAASVAWPETSWRDVAPAEQKRASGTATVKLRAETGAGAGGGE